MERNKEGITTEISRMKQMWQWWQAKFALAAQSPWYASYLLRQFYNLMKALRPSKQLIASTVTGAALLVGSIALNPASANIAIITVNSTADTAVGGDGECTLREALINANDATSTDQSSGDCAAGTGGGSDTIDLTGVSGTITLTSDLPLINNPEEDIVLNGPGAANLTIDGVNLFKTIYSTWVNGDVTIDGLTITRSSLNALDVGGNVILTNSVLSGNMGHGINTSGDVTILNSNLSGNGFHGAISNSNGVSVTNSTISNNGIDGVFAQTDITVTNSTISGNSFVGIYALNNAIVINSTISGNTNHGIYAHKQVAVTNSTISGNGNTGVYSHYDNISIANSTVTGNTGQGILALDGYNTGVVVNIKNSLIVGNNGSAGDIGCETNLATVTTNGKNLISNSTGCAALAGEVTTVPMASILNPLANNGGSTSTHALISGSPAIDVGNNADAPGATDQRGTGFTRISNGTIDIGAFEVQSSATNGSNTVGVSEGEIASLVVVNKAQATAACLGTPPPTGYNFPHGFFEFDINDLVPSGTTDIALTLSSAMPVGTKLFKCNSANQWVAIPNTSDDGDNVLTYALTDGVSNTDHDGMVNGIIEDPIVPAIPSAVGGVAELITPQTASPATTTGIMATLSALFMGAGAWLMRRR